MTDLIVHWLHLSAAILWVGSLLFTSLAVQPVLRRQLSEETRLAVYGELGRRYNVLQWSCWAVLVATGLLKLWPLRNSEALLHGRFGAVLGLKLALAAGMVVLSVLHSHSWGPRLVALGPAHPDFPALARRAALWGKVNAGLVLAIVFCASLLRFNPGW